LLLESLCLFLFDRSLYACFVAWVAGFITEAKNPEFGFFLFCAHT
jgi:hypothetical protein